MAVKLWTKKQTQEIIKALRAAGLPVVKTESKYEVNIDGKTIFRAMQGTRGYLVTYIDDLFIPA